MFGVIGVKPGELLEYSCKDIFDAHIGWWAYENTRQRGDWERARMVAFYASAPHSKAIKKPKDVITFHWEKKEGITREENEAMIKAGKHPLQKYIDGKKAP